MLVWGVALVMRMVLCTLRTEVPWPLNTCGSSAFPKIDNVLVTAVQFAASGSFQLPA